MVEPLKRMPDAPGPEEFGAVESTVDVADFNFEEGTPHAWCNWPSCGCDHDEICATEFQRRRTVPRAANHVSSAGLQMICGYPDCHAGSVCGIHGCVRGLRDPHAPGIAWVTRGPRWPAGWWLLPSVLVGIGLWTLFLWAIFRPT